MTNPVKLITSLLLACFAGQVTAAPTKPNIVFIYADDWGWGDLSCHGSTWLKTPNIDKLASQGTDFQQFNVLNPVCSASRVGLMTGQNPARWSVHQHFATPALNRKMDMPDWLDPEAPTLARFLKQAGYKTAHFGKWHLTNAQTEGAPLPKAYGYDQAKVFNGGAGWQNENTHATAANTAAFIKENKDEPFFINVWIHESHTPHMPTKESMEQWKHLDERKQIYAAVITDGDNSVGTILDALDAEGLAENTIVVFSSDNGPESTGPKSEKLHHGAKGRFGTYYSIGETGGLRGQKRSLFEGGVRTPGIIRWPGHTAAGVENNTTVLTTVDMLPTLCAAAGVTLPDDYNSDGENLLAALDGKEVARTRPIFWEWRGYHGGADLWPNLAVRDGNWKLAISENGKQVELHNLADDRAEAVNVAANHPEVVERLSKLVHDWKATLPTAPNPECISKSSPPATETKITPKKPISADLSKARAKAFTRWDSNEDQILTLDEYEAGLAGQENLEQRFKGFDSNDDGKLTFEEFAAPSAK